MSQLRKLSGEPEWESALAVRKDKEHFIFTVQSTGARPPPLQPPAGAIHVCC